MKTAYIVLAVVLAVVSVLVGRFITVLEVLKEVKTHGPDNCFQVPSLQAPEDVVLIPGTRQALMGIDDRMTLWTTPGKGPKDAPMGGISVMNLPKDLSDRPQIRPVELQNWPKNIAFHPHGLYILNNTLYVVNHAFSQGGERVDLFLISNPASEVALTYERSILLPDYMLGIGNDLAVISDQEFFISVWRTRPDTPSGRTHSLWHTLQDLTGLLLGLERSYVHRCREREGRAICQVVASGLSMNGVTIRGEELWTADTVGRVIKRFHISQEKCTELSTIPVPFMVDNLEYDSERDLIYMGTLARGWDFLSFVQRSLAGQKVTGGLMGGCDELDPKTGLVRQIVMQELENGVSSCSRSGQFVVMGSWQDPNVLLCPIEDAKHL